MSTRSDRLLPYTTLVRSGVVGRLGLLVERRRQPRRFLAGLCVFAAAPRDARKRLRSLLRLVVLLVGDRELLVDVGFQRIAREQAAEVFQPARGLPPVLPRARKSVV